MTDTSLVGRGLGVFVGALGMLSVNQPFVGFRAEWPKTERADRGHFRRLNQQESGFSAEQKGFDTKEKLRLTFASGLLLGPMIAGILVETGQAAIRLPRLPFNIAQGSIGCLVANAFTPEIIHSFMQQRWPIFLAIVLIISSDP
jgi:hypothetical protein